MKNVFIPPVVFLESYSYQIKGDFISQPVATHINLVGDSNRRKRTSLSF